MSVRNASVVAEINRLIEVYDSLPKEVQLEIIAYIKGHSPGRYLSARRAPKKEIKGFPTVGTINLYIE